MKMIKSRHDRANRRMRLVAGMVGLGVAILTIPRPALAATTGSWPNGTVVRFPGQPSVFVVENSRLHWVETPQMFQSLGLSWANVHTVPFFGQRPRVHSPVTYLQPKGSNIIYEYVPQTGTCVPLTTPPGQGATYLSEIQKANLQGIPGSWQVVETGKISQPPQSAVYSVNQLPGKVKPYAVIIPALAGASSFERDTFKPTSSSNALYGLINGIGEGLHWIPNRALFRAVGYSNSHVMEGNPFPLPITTPMVLFRQVGKSRIYFESHGQLHWVPSVTLFNQLGFKWHQVQQFTQLSLPMPIGAPLSAQNRQALVTNWKR